MKIGYLSDIHLEFSFIELKNDQGIDILIIAGDICPANNSFLWTKFLEQITKEFNTIFIILGNHCHYHGLFKTTQSRLTKITKKFRNVKILNRQSEQIKNLNIFGTTLWTPIEDIRFQWFAKTYMNDMSYIKGFSCEVQTQEFYKNKKWISELKRKDGFNLLVTHHLPHESCIAEKFKDSKLNFAFCAYLEESLINKFDMVIFGHTHTNHYSKLNNTILTCNPVGYPGEETGYHGIKTFEI